MEECARVGERTIVVVAAVGGEIGAPGREGGNLAPRPNLWSSAAAAASRQTSFFWLQKRKTDFYLVHVRTRGEKRIPRTKEMIDQKRMKARRKTLSRAPQG
jgi:hypothetical protein